MSFDLDRFLAAQDGVYADVVAELRRGFKTGHWMWYVFPQLAGLGRSDVSRYYAITSLDEARGYLAHPLLGPRLRECAAIVAANRARNATEIFGALDGMKLHSCMTLFHRAAPDDAIFRDVLGRFFDGKGDEKTDVLLALEATAPSTGVTPLDHPR